MNENHYNIGTCEMMCPPSEVELRKKNKLVHFFERKVFVKEFTRSSAGSNQSPSSLRTFSALQKTLDYLFNKILLNQDKPFHVRYDFIFDRCRSIRQDIVIQNFPCDKTVQLLEPIVMFLSFSMYRLKGSPIAIFDPKICYQHLHECLLKCLSSYEKMDQMNHFKYSLENRIIVEAIYLMVNIENPAVLQRAVQLNQKLKASFIVHLAIKISLNFHLKNFYKFLRDIQKLPHVISAVASLKLPHLRKSVLRVFSIAYNSSILNVPVDFIKSLLIYDEMETLLQDLRNLGIQVVNEENPMKVVFNRSKFDPNKSISNTSHQFVEERLSDYHLPDLILMKTVS